MATIYELKTMSHGYQIGNSLFFDTREEAEQARKAEKAAGKAYRKFSLAESGHDPGRNFRYYIKKHENAVLWTVHTKDQFNSDWAKGEINHETTNKNFQATKDPN